MVNVHHKALKLFSLSGSIYDDSAIWRLKIEYVNLITTEMRLSGYVPRVDIDPDFTVEYNEKAEYYNFKISLYGIYVGKRKSEWISGVDGHIVIPILPSKSNEYSQEVA
jgi:hypothetical protein